MPGGDERLREFVAAKAPVPVDVISNPSAPLRPSDLAVLVVESVDPSVRAAATRVLTDNVPYVVLVRRDVWSVGSDAIHLLLDEVQRDPRRKLIRFWRDRDELERTLLDDVFTLDDSTLIEQSVRDGSFVKVGSSFEQTWEIENTGFCVWEERADARIGDGAPERRDLARAGAPHRARSAREDLGSVHRAGAAAQLPLGLAGRRGTGATRLLSLGTGALVPGARGALVH